MPWRPRQLAWLTAGLVVLALLAWGRTLGDAFLADDFARVHEARKAATALHALRLHPGAGEHMFVRPLLFLSFWLDHWLFGAAPLGYRLVNLGLHVVNALLVAVLVRGATDSLRAAWLASLAFVIFPLHAEAVVWISGRVDVLCATGVLAALCAWQRFARPGGRSWHLGLACVCFAAGLLAKEMAITVPLLALALVWRPGERLDRRTWIGVATLAAVAGLYLVARVALLGGLGGYRAPDGASLHALPFTTTAARYAARALLFLAVPTHRELHPALADPVRVGCAVALALAWALAFAQDRARTSGATWRGLVLVLVALLPVAGWAVLPDDNRMTRMLYLPSAFFCAAVGHVLDVGWENRRRLVLAATVALLAAYALGSLRATRLWHATSELVRADTARILAECQGLEGIELVVTGFPAERHGTQMWNNAFYVEAPWMPAGVRRVSVLGLEEWSRRVALGLAGPGSARVFLRRSSELGVVRSISPGRTAPHTNALGLFDDEETAARPAAVRVLVASDGGLGGVESNAESFAAVLEQLANERSAGQFEVLHASTDGAAPAELLRRYVTLEPVLVVLVQSRGRLLLDAGRARIADEARRSDYERTMRAAMDVNSAAVEQALGQAAYVKAFPEAAAASLQLAQERIAEAQRVCEENGVELLLVLLPAFVDEEIDDPSTLGAMQALGLEQADLDRARESAGALVAWARFNGIATVDLHDALGRAAEPCFRALDQRLDARGHSLAAHAVLDEAAVLFERLAR